MAGLLKWAPRRSKWNRLRVEAIIGAPDLRRFGQWGRDDGSEGCIYARAWFERAMEACRPKAGVAERGALFACPDCQRACKAHDFASFTWQHLNFFQHHCFIAARVPRVDCPDHGVKRVTVPWARADSRFTLLFEQAALILAREMPVAAAARFMGITDKRLWRTAFSTKPSNGPRSSIRLACSSWNTSQI